MSQVSARKHSLMSGAFSFCGRRSVALTGLEFQAGGLNVLWGFWV